MVKKKEPTNRDLLEAINGRFNMVFSEFKRIDNRVELIYPYLHSLRQDVKEIKETQKVDGEVLDEIRDELGAVSKAVDKDAVTVLNHVHRIIKLERMLTKK